MTDRDMPYITPEKPTVSKSSEQKTQVVDLEDGPLFRATIKEYEKRTSVLKSYLKRILKTASATLEAKQHLLEQDKLFMEALREAPFTEPLFSHYLDETWDKLYEQQERLAFCMQNLLIIPLQKLYDMDIKAVDAKRRQFEDVSKDYYSNLSKYLSIKTPGMIPDIKEKRKQKTEFEFKVKKSEFDLVRFDYYQFLTDLHGGKKEQEILYHLLNHYEKEYAYHQAVSKTLEPHKQGLDQLATLIAEASREQKMVNQERDEKRKLLVSKYTPSQSTDESEKRKSFLSSSPSVLLTSPMMDMGSPPPLSDEDKIGLGIQLENKFKGIRDLEPQDQAFKDSTGRRKEGFLFATSKPSKNHHNTPTFDMSSAVNWHKYWCVLSGGQLHEYSNWKKQLESHIEPINLRFATVREARNTDRRFCFEVITPQFRRMYQATSDEELASWITTINNAISSLLNGMGSAVDLSSSPSTKKPNGHWKHTRSFSGALSGLAAAKDKYLKKRHSSPQKPLVISLPMIIPTQEAKSDRLLTELRKDLSNTICADCSAKNPDWCSLNLGILICIECSGIHRSLGTHISKVRSLTLDSASFTADIIQLLLQIGNAKSNEIWEATLAEHGTKPVPTDTREAKLKYIQSKYMDKALVKQLDMNPMDLLYTAIEQDDIPKALYAIALGADINQPLEHTDSIPLMTKSNLQLPILDVNGNEYLDRTMQVTVLPDDRFIVRYAIHFALLTQDTQDASRVFSMAEFLFQNGADVFIVDQVNGRLLADLIGVGELVDDEAIDYLNMKNSLRGQAAILRRQTIPPPVLT